MEHALKFNNNTLFLLTETLLLDKLLIDFEKAKNKISGINFLGENFLSHEMILVDSIDNIKLWKEVLFTKAKQLYKEFLIKKIELSTNVTDVSTNVTDVSTNVTDVTTNETDVSTNVTDIILNDEEILENSDFINIYCKIIQLKKNVILSNETSIVNYLSFENSLKTTDFFRRVDSASFKDITTSNKNIYFKNEKLRSLTIFQNYDNEKMITVNKSFIILLNETDLINYKLFNLKNNKKLLFKLPSTHNLFHQSMDSSCNLLNLISIWKNNYNDFVMFYQDKTHNHIQLENMILYDYKDTSKFTNDFYSNKLLLGSLDTNTDCELLQEHDISYQPWIYWPKHADKVEAFIDNSQCTLPNFEERTKHSIFIGKHSESREQLKNTIEHVTLYNNEETQMSYDNYLQNISQSKFGICVKGSQPKSRRLMEYLAVGTVPIIVKNQINTTSFENPLHENIHFLSVDSIEDVNHIIQTTTKETWNELSENGKTWYFKNIHSSNSFKNLITKFFS
jgi:hypothetical protein